MNGTPTRLTDTIVLDRVVTDTGPPPVDRVLYTPPNHDECDDTLTIRYEDFEMDAELTVGTYVWGGLDPEKVYRESVFVHDDVRRYLTLPPDLTWQAEKDLADIWTDALADLMERP